MFFFCFLKDGYIGAFCNEMDVIPPEIFYRLEVNYKINALYPVISSSSLVGRRKRLLSPLDVIHAFEAQTMWLPAISTASDPTFDRIRRVNEE